MADSAHTSPLSERPAILVVDDEPRVLRSIKAAFKSRYCISTAGDAAEAKRLLEQGAPCDVIVSDERMPNETGHELLAWARVHRPQCVRILLSGTDFNRLESEIESAEVFSCLGKPWDLEEFGRTLDLAVAKARQGEEARGDQSSSPAGELLILDTDLSYQGLYRTLAESLDEVGSIKCLAGIEALYDRLEGSTERSVACVDLAYGAEAVQALLKRLGAALPHITVVVTGTPSAARAYMAGGYHKPDLPIISKPVSATRLMPIIKAAMGHG